MVAQGEGLSPVELKEQLEAERAGDPFLAYRGQDGSRSIVTLGAGRSRLTLGRSAACDLWLDWDAQVSGLHATLERLGRHWVLSDDGLSRNGTWVNGRRVRGQARLRGGDRIRCGRTILVFYARQATHAGTVPAAATPAPPPLSPAQQRVLRALCRPLVATGDKFALPATNQEIAAELVLTVDAVKTHLRALFEKFEVGDLPQNRKRVRLAELAVERGALAPSEVLGG